MHMPPWVCRDIYFQTLLSILFMMHRLLLLNKLQTATGSLKKQQQRSLSDWGYNHIWHIDWQLRWWQLYPPFTISLQSVPKKTNLRGHLLLGGMHDGGTDRSCMRHRNACVVWRVYLQEVHQTSKGLVMSEWNTGVVLKLLRDPHWVSAGASPLWDDYTALKTSTPRYLSHDYLIPLSSSYPLRPLLHSFHSIYTTTTGLLNFFCSPDARGLDCHVHAHFLVQLSA